MIFSRNKTPEKEVILCSGEKIVIRQLTPAERLRYLSMPGDTGFCKRMKAGLITPEISFREAKKILNKTPFRALEIVRAIQIFSKEMDYLQQNEQFQKQNEQFLKTLQALETLKKFPG